MKEMFYANSLIYRGIQENNPITQLHLHKLMYMVQGYYLCRSQGESLGNKMFQPWDMGPVMPEVYHFLKSFGPRPITSYCLEFNPNTFRNVANMVSREDKLFHGILNEVWLKYRHLSVSDLISLTHKKDGGWDKARQAHSMYIKNKDIKKEFTAIINQEESND